ncbi:bromodomain-containing protein 7 isoform X2 [Octopus sinensis]|uniref:Bromodomain-containing protein 7 isoform X2 n=1 Tax=Octopus sinensis TaxID=2607531 RepID=A0A6P7SHZ0_9MOLL|nr:bromodomain-containing protein 7 isoform X2 [Octopus sinensis]
MGKKHKKHHKSDKKILELEEKPSEKPLKLVLKVTEPVPEVYTGDTEERRHKHKKKKKKKSSEKEKHRHHEDGRPHKRERDEYESELHSHSPPYSSPAAKQLFLSPPTSTPHPPDKAAEDDEPIEKRMKLSNQEEEPNNMKTFLKYMTKQFQRKDTHGFFAFPVNDVIAPGYSSIIQKPMDFSTILSKVDDEEYASTKEFKKDFILMCQNAMIYNRPETIYYKEARRLLHMGVKQLSKENLLGMKRNLDFMNELTMEELGLEDESEDNIIGVNDDNFDSVTDDQHSKEKKHKKQKTSLSRFEAIPDNMTPEEILAQARAAAKEAADLLTLRQPKAQYGFLRRRKDGSTSLTILNPENDGKVSDTEKVVNLGGLASKLTNGTGVLTGFKEDKRNKISPVSYLNYGPFSSYAPSFDSSFANITKEESDMLMTTYGDETGVQYAKSIMAFADSTGDYTIKMVDNLLDVLTNGEHSRVQGQIDQRKKEESKKQAQAAAELDQAMAAASADTSSQDPYDVDFESLKTLSSDLGMDLSFLDHFEKEISKEKELQQKLDYTAGLIQDLHSTQHDRLSAKPPVHLAFVPGPSQKEAQLANKVTQELRELAKQANPGAVVSVKALRNAMGISNNPIDDLLDPYNLDDDDNGQALLSAVGQGEESALPMDIEQELNEFLEQGSLLKPSQSPKDTKVGLDQNTAL